MFDCEKVHRQMNYITIDLDDGNFNYAGVISVAHALRYILDSQIIDGEIQMLQTAIV